MKAGLVLMSVFLCCVLSAQNRHIVFFKDKAKSEAVSVSQKCRERLLKTSATQSDYDKAVSLVYLQQLIDSGFTIHKVSRWLNAAVISGDQDLSAITAIKDFTSIGQENLQVLEEMEISSFINDVNQAPHQGQALRDNGLTGKNVLVAVFDAGFRGVDTLQAFAHLYNQGRLKFTRDYVGNSSVFGYDSHGTLVLSVMAAKIPNRYEGIAPDADYALFVTENVASESREEEFNWVLAAETADSLGVDIINSSLSYVKFDNPAEDYNYEDLDGKTAISTRGAAIAASRGILVVNSAGNSRATAFPYIGAPADADSILTVAAIDSAGRLAPFSSKGPSADGRIKPEVAALGFRTWLVGPDGKIFQGNGTSFSSPIIAALAACLKEALPGYSAYDLRELIIKSSHLYFNPNNDLGYGIPDMKKALVTTQIMGPDQNSLMFPNPFSKQLFLHHGNFQGLLRLKLIDSAGKIVGTRSIEDASLYRHLDLTDLFPESTGVYLLQIESANSDVQVLTIIKTPE